MYVRFFFFFSSRRRHTRCYRDWSSDVCSSDLCDRENARVEIFDRDGGYLGEWPGLANPMQIFVRDEVLYLAESNQRVSIMTIDGDVLARWGSKGPAPDQFTNAPHSIWADSHGDVYVSEVVDPNTIQKYTRNQVL